jgi:hypothetical protein
VRMTRPLQATLTAGLVLCGTAYLSHGEVISRQAIVFFVLGAGLMLSVRRALWRRMWGELISGDEMDNQAGI